jgi:urease accessory protein
MGMKRVKRIMTKRTNGGQELTTKFLQADPQLREGDVLSQKEHYIIAVEILPCEVIVTKPFPGTRLPV